MDTFRVCFVCTGNICRSPMAEAVFRAQVTEAGLEDRITASSAGTGGWHIGEPADPRTTGTLEAAGYELTHRARQFEPSWFAEHDLVVALDEGHERELRAIAPTPEDAAKVRLLRRFDPAASAGVAPGPPVGVPPGPPGPRVGVPPGPSGPRGSDGFGLDVPDPYYGGEQGFEEVLRLVEAAVPGVLAEAVAALEQRLTGTSGGHHGEEAG